MTTSWGILFYLDDKYFAGVDVQICRTILSTEKCDIVGKSVVCYTLEHILADKTSALLSEKRYRRVKDLYDIHVILRNSDICTEYVFELLYNKVLDEVAVPFTEDIIEKIEHAYMKLDVRGYYVRELNKPDFKVVYTDFMQLVAELYGFKRNWHKEGHYFGEV